MRQSPFGELYGVEVAHVLAACSGFHYIGPAPRNPQLILNLLVVRGCVATAGRLKKSNKPYSLTKPLL